MQETGEEWFRITSELSSVTSYFLEKVHACKVHFQVCVTAKSDDTEIAQCQIHIIKVISSKDPIPGITKEFSVRDFADNSLNNGTKNNITPYFHRA